MNAALTNKQKADLSIVVSAAYPHRADNGQPPGAADMTVEDWRRDVCQRVFIFGGTKEMMDAWAAAEMAGFDGGFARWWLHQIARKGRAGGLTSARQSDFCALLAEFHHIAGNDAAAVHWTLRAEGEKRRQLEWKIRQTLARQRLTEGYAAAIQHKTTLGACSVPELTTILKALSVHERRHPATPPPHD